MMTNDDELPIDDDFTDDFVVDDDLTNDGGFTDDGFRMF
jgi:hypothetical protein